MALITVSTPFNIDLEFKIAEFYKRLAAWFIDVAIISIYFYFAYGYISKFLHYDESSMYEFYRYFITIIPVLLYQLFFEIFMDGQTIGKKIIGIKIIDKEGKEATWGQYFLRWILCLGNLFIYILPYMFVSPGVVIFFLVVYFPDFLSVLISAKSQRLGDIAGGTVVIDKRYKPNINETIYLQIEEEDYNPQFPQVMRLTDRDINGISNLLNSKPSKSIDLYMIEVSTKIKNVLEITSDLNPHEFLQQLMRDYNYYTSK